MVVVLHDTAGTTPARWPRIFLGGDLHDTSYDYMELTTRLLLLATDTNEHCEYDLRIYPSRMMKTHKSNKPTLYTIWF
jgi:hypothetical protein